MQLQNKENKLNNYSYPVMEQFYTLQGEGVYSGCPAYFVRLGGCDVKCFWCDVKDSWDMNKFEKIPASKIVESIVASGAKICVVTGGEPLIHDLSFLTLELQKNNIKTHLETSGSKSISGNWDWVCLSPKKFKEPVKEIFKEANELKIVIYNNSDFEWANNLSTLVNKDCALLLQPEWSKKDVFKDKIINFIKQNPQWRLSLQTHKYLSIP